MKKGHYNISGTMILIIDGNNLAYRCKYVFSLSNHGKDVSVTYGFLRILSSLLAKHKPSSVIVCWDGGTPEHRRQMLPQYKANRHKNDDPEEYNDFLRQLRELQDYALPMMGVINVRKPGAEADDLMYHASRMFSDKIMILSSDKDMLQAINDNVFVISPAKETIYDRKKIEQELEIPLENYIEWRAIQGDSSDNIAGIPGVGEKTATKLFKQFGTLTGIVNAALGINPKGKIEGALGRNISEFGVANITKNVYVMALYADRVGARLAVLEAVDDFHDAAPSRIKKYFLKSAFTSLIESGLANKVAKLEVPEVNIENMRIPIIATRRFPI